MALLTILLILLCWVEKKKRHETDGCWLWRWWRHACESGGKGGEGCVSAGVREGGEDEVSDWRACVNLPPIVEGDKGDLLIGARCKCPCRSSSSLLICLDGGKSKRKHRPESLDSGVGTTYVHTKHFLDVDVALVRSVPHCDAGRKAVCFNYWTSVHLICKAIFRRRPEEASDWHLLLFCTSRPTVSRFCNNGNVMMVKKKKKIRSSSIYYFSLTLICSLLSELCTWYPEGNNTKEVESSMKSLEFTVKLVGDTASCSTGVKKR